MKKFILIIIALAWVNFYLVDYAPKVGPGVLATGEPITAKASVSQLDDGDYKFQVINSYEVDARVLAASNFYFDGMSGFSPLAVVVGWDNMSDEGFINAIDFSISDRRVDWETSVSVINSEEVVRNTQLLHLIPSNGQIKRQAEKIRVGDILTMSGYIVNVKSKNGLSWKTNSKAVKRTGKLFYIEYLEITHPSMRAL